MGVYLFVAHFVHMEQQRIHGGVSETDRMKLQVWGCVPRKVRRQHISGWSMRLPDTQQGQLESVWGWEWHVLAANAVPPCRTQPMVCRPVLAIYRDARTAWASQAFTLKSTALIQKMMLQAGGVRVEALVWTDPRWRKDNTVQLASRIPETFLAQCM